MYEQPERRGRGGLILLTVVLLGALGAGAGLIMANLSGPSKTPDQAGQQPSAEPQETKQCPEPAVSRGAPTQRAYVRTAESRAWICADGNGALYYLGHRGGGEWVEGKNGIFLSGVTAASAGFTVRNEKTTYTVTATELTIDRPVNPLAEVVIESEGFDGTTN